MAEQRGAPSGDVAGALIEQLEAGAELVDVGSFKLDLDKAREKLAAFQLTAPDRFVLLLVEAAHLLRGCTGVAFELDSRRTRVSFEGVELGADELQGCFDALFVELTGLDPEAARHLRGRQRLALALNTALGLADGRVELRSRIADHGELRLQFDARSHVLSEAQPGASSTSKLTLEVRYTSSAALGRRHARVQRALLRCDTRHASLPVWLNGVRVDRGPWAAELIHAAEVRDAGEAVGWAGWCADRARVRLGAIVFVANGVIVETYTDPELQPGFEALVDASDLERDISQAKLARDEAFRRRVEAVAATHAALHRPAPSLGPKSRDGSEMRTGLFVCIAFGFGTIGVWASAVARGAPYLFALPFAALGLGIIYSGIRMFEGAWRSRRVRRRGRVALGVIERSAPTGKRIDNVPQLRIDMIIEQLEGEPYYASLEMLVDNATRPLVQPGAQVYVRVDPSDHTYVVVEAADAGS